jgi:hypothetical protein
MDNKLKLGSSTTIASFVLGFLPSIEKPIQDQITFWFQIVAFSISIIVGLLTACYYIKKLRQKNVG